ncbi:Spy/CpxP family protein refolding chaperone [Oricola cellulosilytica]|nr:Spy/CpxP family protein refolding chaperone [Oricola cellulosilytica]
MKITYRALKTLAIAGAVAAMAAVPAAAHYEGGGWQPGYGAGSMMPGWGWGDGSGRFGPGGMYGGIEARLAFLKTELKITAEQSDAWDETAKTVSESLESHTKTMRDMFRQLQDGTYLKSGLPARLEFQEKHMSAQLEEIKKVRVSVETLYAVLDDDQKKAADELVLPMMGMGMMGAGPGMFGPGMYGPGYGPGMMYR